jgi:hypothetical protein
VAPTPCLALLAHPRIAPRRQAAQNARRAGGRARRTIKHAYLVRVSGDGRLFMRIAIASTGAHRGGYNAAALRLSARREGSLKRALAGAAAIVPCWIAACVALNLIENVIRAS